MTTMGHVKGRVGAIVGTAALIAATGLAASQAIAVADPAGHQVTYTLTSGGDGDFQLFYLTAQPPNKAAYNADAYSYVKQEPIHLTAGQPWTFTTTLADPQWAILTVSSTTHGGQAAPNPHCDIAIDGQIAVQQDGPYNLQCQLSQW
jgi:hypothetical protein